MTYETTQTHDPPSCLVQVGPGPAGFFTARLVGLSELHATASTRDEAVEQLRALLREQVDAGSLLAVTVPQENPLMRWFGHAKDDPDFAEYLDEIRKFREDEYRRSADELGSGECSNSSSTPTT